MNIKVTGKIEKPVEINPLDVVRELKPQLLGRIDYFIGDDGRVWCREYDVVAFDEIQKKSDLVKALNILEEELS